MRELILPNLYAPQVTLKYQHPQFETSLPTPSHIPGEKATISRPVPGKPWPLGLAGVRRLLSCFRKACLCGCAPELKNSRSNRFLAEGINGESAPSLLPCTWVVQGLAYQVPQDPHAIKLLDHKTCVVMVSTVAESGKKA